MGVAASLVPMAQTPSSGLGTRLAALKLAGPVLESAVLGDQQKKSSTSQRERVFYVHTRALCAQCESALTEASDFVRNGANKLILKWTRPENQKRKIKLGELLANQL